MEPFRGAEQSLRSRRVASKSRALHDLRAQQPRAGHNSRTHVGTVVRTCRPWHETRHRRQVTITSRRTPHYPGKQSRAPAEASVAFAQDDRVKCSCDAAGHREPGSRPGKIARGHCNRRLSRNQPKLGVLGFGRRDRAPHRSTESWPCSCLNRAHRRSPIDKYQDDRFGTVPKR